MIRCCSNFLRWGARCAVVTHPGPATDGGGAGGTFLFHGTEIRGYSLECPAGLMKSMLIHILICDIGGVFWTPPPNTARQNSRPYYFLCTPPHRRRVMRSPATLHATVLFHSVAAHQVPLKRRFFLFFCFLLVRRRLYSC